MQIWPTQTWQTCASSLWSNDLLVLIILPNKQDKREMKSLREGVMRNECFFFEASEKNEKAKDKAQERETDCCWGKYARSAEGIRGLVMKVLLSERCYVSLSAHMHIHGYINTTSATFSIHTKCDRTKGDYKEKESKSAWRATSFGASCLAWQGDSSTTPLEKHTNTICLCFHP